MAARILIVDDDDDLREQLQMQLESAGYEVVSVDKAADAADALATAKPDLAIYDLMLEEVDSGFILCHRTKQTHPDLPIIMLSGVAGETGLAFDASTDNERSWLKADVFLNKPVRVEQVTREIERLLKRKKED